MNLQKIDNLRDTIEVRYQCRAEHVASTVVTQPAASGKVATAVVETFELVGNLEARRCYAWMQDEGGKLRSAAVLEVPPVDSPQKALNARTLAAKFNFGLDSR